MNLENPVNLTNHGLAGKAWLRATTGCDDRSLRAVQDSAGDEVRLV